MVTRRSLLAGCGAVLGATATSGCSALPIGDGGGDDGSGTYRDWIHDVDRDFAIFTAVQPSTVVSIDGLPDGVAGTAPYGLANEDIDWQLNLESSTVLRGSFDSATVRDQLEQRRQLTLSADGEYEEYQLYTTSEASLAVGVRDDVTVVSDVPTLERMVDASRGEGERLVDANDDFELLTDELDTGHVVTGSVDLAGGDGGGQRPQVASGSRYEYGAEETEQSSVVVFRTADAADEEQVRAQIEQSNLDVSDLESTTDGRVVQLSFTIQTEDLAP